MATFSNHPLPPPSCQCNGNNLGTIRTRTEELLPWTAKSQQWRALGLTPLGTTCTKSTEMEKGKFRAQTVKTGHHNWTQLHAESTKMFITILTQTCWVLPCFFILCHSQSTHTSRSAEFLISAPFLFDSNFRGQILPQNLWAQGNPRCVSSSLPHPSYQVPHRNKCIFPSGV